MNKEQSFSSQEENSLPLPDYRTVGLRSEEYQLLVRDDSRNADSFSNVVKYWQAYIDDVHHLHKFIDDLVLEDDDDSEDEEYTATDYLSDDNTDEDDDCSEDEEDEDESLELFADDSFRLDTDRIQALVDAGNELLDGKVDTKQITKCRDLVATSFWETKETIQEQKDLISDLSLLLNDLLLLHEDFMTEEEKDNLYDYQKMIAASQEIISEYQNRLGIILQADRYISTMTSCFNYGSSN